MRDASWRTVRSELLDVALDAAGARFTLAVLGHASGDGLAVEWRAAVEGGSDGTVAYELEATVGAGSRYNRLGLCLLTEGDGTAGVELPPYGVVELDVVAGPDGTEDPVSS